MSRAKKIKYADKKEFIEDKLDIIDKIRGETLQKTALYLKKCAIPFGYLIDFLNNPVHYPGKHNGTRIIFERFLTEVVSQNYVKIQQSNMTIKFVLDTVFKQIFRGKK